MPKDTKIAELLRQETMLEKQIVQLEKKRRALTEKKQSLFYRRWLLAVRNLVGKEVTPVGRMQPELRQLDDQVGTLRSIARNGMCQVDFGDLGVHEMHGIDIRASDSDQWERLLDGE